MSHPVIRLLVTLPVAFFGYVCRQTKRAALPNDDRRPHAGLLSAIGIAALAGGCATPQYAVRPTSQPVESHASLEIERTISAEQAR